MTWRDEAACRGMQVDLFFPHANGSAAAAKAVCGRCEVRQSCLAHAIDAGETDGVWGGYRANERWKLDGRQPVRFCVECDVRYRVVGIVGARAVATCSPECAAERRRINREKSARHRVGTA